jgi:ElaB/YqjD/DUF883 family membrane-anchored ribosome-binding protein
MTAAPDPFEPAGPEGAADLSDSVRTARERLQEEIERVRSSVEEMLDEQGEARGARGGRLRAELEQIRLENRDYVKRRIRKSEKKMRREVRELDARADRLERQSDELKGRIDRVELDRREAEWRIHRNTEAMLDGLLLDVRAIADRLAGPPRG